MLYEYLSVSEMQKLYRYPALFLFKLWLQKLEQ